MLMRLVCSPIELISNDKSCQFKFIFYILINRTLRYCTLMYVCVHFERENMILSLLQFGLSIDVPSFCRGHYNHNTVTKGVYKRPYGCIVYIILYREITECCASITPPKIYFIIHTKTQNILQYHRV